MAESGFDPHFILDATVWLNFAKADIEDDLVRAFAGRLCAGSVMVNQELLRRPRASGRAGQPFVLQGVTVLDMNGDERSEYGALKSRFPGLGSGEREALVLAKSRHLTLATDDGLARATFTERFPSVKLTTTEELLFESVTKGYVARDSADRILRLTHRKR